MDTTPVSVRLKLAGGGTVLVRAFPPRAESPPPCPEREVPEWAPSRGPSREQVPSQTLVVIIEAVPAQSDQLAATVLSLAEEQGQTSGLLCLDAQNLAAVRYGCPAAPLWLWKAGAPELFVRQGTRVIVPAPASETEIDAADVDRILRVVRQETDVTVVVAGCHWKPKLLSAVMPSATHIWLVTRPGQWAGVEMRLQQAEFSGWTDLERMRLVVIGEGPAVPAEWRSLLAGELPGAGGEQARHLALQEFRRVQK